MWRRSWFDLDKSNLSRLMVGLWSYFSPSNWLRSMLSIIVKICSSLLFYSLNMVSHFYLLLVEFN